MTQFQRTPEAVRGWVIRQFVQARGKPISDVQFRTRADFNAMSRDMLYTALREVGAVQSPDGWSLPVPGTTKAPEGAASAPNPQPQPFTTTPAEARAEAVYRARGEQRQQAGTTDGPAAGGSGADLWQRRHAAALAARARGPAPAGNGTGFESADAIFARRRTERGAGQRAERRA